MSDSLALTFVTDLMGVGGGLSASGSGEATGLLGSIGAGKGYAE